MTSEYEYMQETVDEICRSLIENPEDWVFTTHTFNKKGSDVEYWDSSSHYAITCTWDGYNTNTVFSVKQGRIIREAYMKAREKQASNAQLQVVRDIEKRKTKELRRKPWWKLW